MFFAFVTKAAPIAVKAISGEKIVKIISCVGTLAAIVGPYIEDKIREKKGG